MSDINQDKSPVETAVELKELLTEYARQETIGPFKLLGRWIAFGIVGAIFVALGSIYLAFALLRGLQTLETFQGDGGSWVPYVISFGSLLICIGLAARAVTREFSDDASRTKG